PGRTFPRPVSGATPLASPAPNLCQAPDAARQTSGPLRRSQRTHPGSHRPRGCLSCRTPIGQPPGGRNSRLPHARQTSTLHPLFFAYPEFLAQLKLSNLPRARLGKRIFAELNNTRQLEPAQTLGQKAVQLVFCKGRLGFPCDDGSGYFPPFIVRR